MVAVEVWAFDLKAKRMTRVRIISNDKVKFEDITVLDFISTKFQTEITAMNRSGKNLQLQFFDATGKLVKAKDVGELDKD
ncbi:hypothetical protein IMSHALPRED_001315 [Imshaugia aleurites]|uniref:Uncharacterized protein n=1 Tax=Imshaugia aleurites TaxID=172621 RepID=A0A8H3J2H1_9LECA|nr:hypothetical protein IMSHALPRED_001315 [Imshaugia aleurites]